MSEQIFGSNTASNGYKYQILTTQDQILAFLQNPTSSTAQGNILNKSNKNLINITNEQNYILQESEDQDVSDYVGSDIELKTKNPISQQDKLKFEQSSIYAQYIAPNGNKDIDGVLNDDEQHKIFYSPNYRYGTDAIQEYYNIIPEPDDSGGGGGECQCHLVWEDME